jgi:hypothetical protein
VVNRRATPVGERTASACGRHASGPANGSAPEILPSPLPGSLTGPETLRTICSRVPIC